MYENHAGCQMYYVGAKPHFRGFQHNFTQETYDNNFLFISPTGWFKKGSAQLSVFL